MKRLFQKQKSEFKWIYPLFKWNFYNILKYRNNKISRQQHWFFYHCNWKHILTIINFNEIDIFYMYNVRVCEYTVVCMSQGLYTCYLVIIIPNNVIHFTRTMTIVSHSPQHVGYGLTFHSSPYVLTLSSTFISFKFPSQPRWYYISQLICCHLIILYNFVIRCTFL